MPLLHSLLYPSPLLKRVDPTCLKPLCPTNLLSRSTTFQASPTRGPSLVSVIPLDFTPVAYNVRNTRHSTPSMHLFKKEPLDMILTRNSIQVYSLEHQSHSRCVYFKASYNIRASYHFSRLHRYTYTPNFLVKSRD